MSLSTTTASSSSSIRSSVRCCSVWNHSKDVSPSIDALLEVAGGLPEESILELLQRARELVIKESWKGRDFMGELPEEAIQSVGLFLGFRSLSAMATTSQRVRQLLGPVWRQTGLLLFDGFAMDGEIFDDPSIYAGTSGTSLKHAVNREKDDYRFWPLRCGHFMNGIAFEECPYLVPRDGVPSSVQLRSTEVTDITAEDLSIALEDVSPSQHTGLQGESHAAQGDDNGGGRVRSVPSGSCSFTCPSKFEIPTTHERGIYLEYLVDLHFSPSATRAVVGVIDGSHMVTPTPSCSVSTTASDMDSLEIPSSKLTDSSGRSVEKMETCDFALETDPSMWAIAFGPLSAVLSSQGKYFDQFETYAVAGSEDSTENHLLLRDCLHSALRNIVSVRVGIYFQHGKVAFFRKVEAIGPEGGILAAGDSTSYDCTGFVYKARPEQRFLRPALMCCNVNGDDDFVRAELTAVCNKPPYDPHDNIEALDYPSKWEQFAPREIEELEEEEQRLAEQEHFMVDLESLDDVHEVAHEASSPSVIDTPRSSSAALGGAGPRWLSLSSDNGEETPVIGRNMGGGNMTRSSSSSDRTESAAYFFDSEDFDSVFEDGVAGT